MSAPMHYQSLTSLVAQMRDGSLSAREVTEHHLARIAALDPKLHACTAALPATDIARRADA
jgi:Asp-tRNA(Asn)/Glu-tRNA(Gln) amidotransferase A subunit family amidase